MAKQEESIDARRERGALLMAAARIAFERRQIEQLEHRAKEMRELGADADAELAEVEIARLKSLASEEA